MQPVFNHISHVGLVVKDVYASVETYVHKYGIGPWEISKFDSTLVDGMHIYGEARDYGLIVAQANIGNMRWELNQPLDDNLYAEFLQSHGEGVHHIAVSLTDVNHYFRYCEENELHSLQGGIIRGRNKHNLLYDCRDTSGDLSVILEIFAPEPGYVPRPPDYIYPPGPMPRPPMFKEVVSLSFLCQNLDKAITTYTHNYGIGPWEVYSYSPETVAYMSIGGKPHDWNVDIGICTMGHHSIALIQPHDAFSDCARQLEHHGGQLYSVTMEPESLESIEEYCKKNGIKSVLGGNWLKTYRYNYRDFREDLKVVVKLLDVSPDFMWPQPKAVYMVPMAGDIMDRATTLPTRVF